jgi:MFS family permease
MSPSFRLWQWLSRTTMQHRRIFPDSSAIREPAILRRVLTALSRQLSESLQATRDVFANPNLRRLHIAGAASLFGIWAYNVALVVFAYAAGGARDVGLVAALRIFPPAIIGPFAAALADRFPRKRVMLLSDLARVLFVALAAAVMATDGPPLLVYACVSLNSVVATPFAPAAQAIRQSLVRRPAELTASIATSSTVASLATFAAPALGGILLAATSPSAVFGVTAFALAVSAWLVFRLSPPRGTDEGRVRADESRTREFFAGFIAILREAPTRLVVGLYLGATVLAGVLNVLVVVVAVELLDLGDAGVGYLYTTNGIGSLVGSLIAFLFVGRDRVGAQLAIALALYGGTMALVGAVSSPGPALVLFALSGLAGSTIGVTGQALLQRIVDEDVMARVFGVFGSLVTGAAGVGSVLGPVLADSFGVRAALVAAGAVAPVLAMVCWRALARVDVLAAAPTRELALLRCVPMLNVLPATVLEDLAEQLESRTVAAGADVFRAGDDGDRFYVIDDGEADVRIDGRVSTRLHGGDHFGEIALLHDVPRTATVTARTDLTLGVLRRDVFLEAVTAHAPSAELAESVVASRLGAAEQLESV